LLRNAERLLIRRCTIEATPENHRK